MATATAPVREPVVARAQARVSSGSVDFFRVAYGLIGAAIALRFLAKGWVESLLLAPRLHLTYPGFDWVAPAPGVLSYVHLLAMAACGLAIAFGYRTKVALGGFLFLFAWIELIDASLYLNHYWLVTLIGVLLLALPSPNDGTIETWVVWALRAQVAVVYVFAGLGKLNTDWLLHAQPLSVWLSVRTDRPIVGPFLDLHWVATMASLASAFFDLTIVGWLSWKRSRPFAYAAVVIFHIGTAMLFQIGLFPWMMIALTPIFFAPNWPRRATWDVPSNISRPSNTSWRGWAVGALVVVNLVVPLRHYWEPGDVRWNEAGYYGSFRVMLTEKTGFVRFHLTDPASGETWEVDPAEYFEPWQVSQLNTRRDLLVTAAHLIAREAGGNVEVRADAWVSFDGRPREPFVPADVDLARAPRRIR